MRFGKRSKSFADVTIEHKHAIVCLVGENIRGCPQVSARVFTALGSIKTRMVSQGASQLNISLVVAATDLAPAVESSPPGNSSGVSETCTKLAIIGYGKM